MNELVTGMFVKEKDSDRICIVAEDENERGVLIVPADEREEGGEAHLADKKDLSLLAPLMLRGEKARRILLGIETDLSYMEGFTHPLNVRTDASYVTDVSDLLFAVKRFKEERADWTQLKNWRDLCEGMSDTIGLAGEEKESADTMDLLSGPACLSYAWQHIDSRLYEEEDTYSEYPAPELFDSAIEMLSMFLENESLPARLKTYPDALMISFIERYDYSSIDLAQVEYQELFREFLTRLCRENYPPALMNKGKCLYYGTKIMPQDHKEAYKLLEAYYQVTGEPEACNLLGEICLTGKNKDRKADYKKAFYYFSIGHAGGICNSSLKLSDLFSEGLGVGKHQDTAMLLAVKVYEDVKEAFLSGRVDAVFAEAAYRLGNFFSQGIGEDDRVDLRTAYRYYLEADLAVRLRMSAGENNGDKAVYAMIRKAMKEIRAEYRETKGEHLWFDPDFFDDLISSKRPVKLTVKKQKKGGLKLTFRLMPFDWEEEAPFILETIPEEDYCALTESVRVYTDKKARFRPVEKTKEIIFDMVYADPLIDGRLVFERNKVPQAYLDARHLIKKMPKRCEISGHLEEKNVTVVSVRFRKGGRIYEYLADDGEDIEPGDRVIVSGYEEETLVEVVAVERREESELLLPTDEYERIVRKV